MIEEDVGFCVLMLFKIGVEMLVLIEGVIVLLEMFKSVIVEVDVVLEVEKVIMLKVDEEMFEMIVEDV